MHFFRYTNAIVTTGNRGNTLVVNDSFTAREIRYAYRNLRKAGASVYAARTAVYDLTFALRLRTANVDFVAAAA